jgi:uncharacterized protein with NAD-binding domain and iron-sulfur cluster
VADESKESKAPVVKVAIVGGGCAGITAAWELSKLNLKTIEKNKLLKEGERPYELPYEITVYEKGWRLGGKSASGRDENGRIREHGLHIWLGFYENAFRMMRECYEVVQRQEELKAPFILPHKSFDEAFFPEPHVGVATKDRSGTWEAWTGFLPPMKGMPGEPLDAGNNPFTLSSYLARCIGLCKALMHSVLASSSGEAAPGDPRPTGRSAFDEEADLDFSANPSQSPNVFVERIANFMRVGVLTSAAGILQAATIVEQLLREKNPAPQWSSSILKFLEALATQTRKQLRDFVNADEHIRRKTEIIDLIMTIVVGLYRDKVLFDSRGLDAINHIDCKKWLLQHGAMKESVESPFVTGLYDLAFCYENGDRKKPALAAGQALRGALRMFFTYRGSPFWRMRSGMGETVFSPLYCVLKARGLKFRFMHELSEVKFENLDSRGEAIVSELQFTKHNDADQISKEPLDHFGCWRHEITQFHGQANSVPTTLSLQRLDRQASGEGFHAVVMAMGVDDFKSACKKQFFDAKHMQHWKQMSEHVKTIGTQAAQIWMGKDLDELGWHRGPALVSAFDWSFETWADMTHTLPSERDWRRTHPESPKMDDKVQSISYFCGPLSDSTIKQIENENPRKTEAVTAANLMKHVKANLKTLLETQIQPLWPRVFNAKEGTTALSSLLTATGDDSVPVTNEDLLDAQHVQANWKGSERYTLALPGSLEYRISPLDCSVLNMTIAGDWTECGFNEGCIEAAVMSGMLAAHAISGQPRLTDIVGYDHP